MLTSIKVTGFRALQSLEAKDLGRVNLLVGKNNAGKTSLLEAIELHNVGVTPKSVLVSAGERKEYRFSEGKNAPLAYDISHLFRGHVVEEGAEFTISGNETLVCKFIPSNEQIIDSSDLGLGISVFSGVAGRANRQNLKLQGEYTCGLEKVTWSFPVTREGIFLPGGTRTTEDKVKEFPSSPHDFIRTTNTDNAKITRYWDYVLQQSQEKDVISLLQIIEPNLQELAVLLDPSIPSYFHRVLCRLEGSNVKVPLTSLGDGVSHLLVLALYLQITKGGCLLIDEIDTGLHYSAMQKMWEMVIETAKRLDIQVFATTHSQDCIQALAWLQEEKPELCEEVRLHQMKKDAKKTQSFDAEAIQRAVENLSELR
jgi:AAA15 family ATPase/GTPase